MSTQETALAICQRIRGRTHFSQISIGPDMQLTDQFQIIIQHFIKVFAFFSCLGQNHRQMQGYRTDIETSHKYRLVLVICRMHAASLIPWRQKCSASHGRYDLAILLVHACHIALRDTWSWQSIPHLPRKHPPAAFRGRADSHHIRIRS